MNAYIAEDLRKNFIRAVRQADWDLTLCYHDPWQLKVKAGETNTPNALFLADICDALDGLRAAHAALSRAANREVSK